ncbi:hypothetical protein EUAN_01790 [Andreesenia angusta]|uniref:Sulfate exporter family transporter n=1 Tax=Andreesenia angusta TaxID=39480 RepID=A0A1S1VA72_9FIRM|nr:putative sulfate exporter family transporter [Andreesenia angusta]OHW63315.1 hypothetical protein EUAN_01790 [Andreesenia angusta]
MELEARTSILPGIGACMATAYVGNAIGEHVPSLGGGFISIILGIVLGNTVLRGEVFERGKSFSESNLLSYSIVLLGGTMSFQAVMDIGPSGVLFIAVQMTATILAAFFIGRKLGFSENFSLLMASGNAVCGSSAIGATAPVIDADDEDKSNSITVVNITGTVLMLILPLLAESLFSLETYRTSSLIGGVLQSVGQVIASGSMVNEEVKSLSTIFKIVRIIFLVFVVIGYSAFKSRGKGEEKLQGSGFGFSNIKLPWYIVGFFITCSMFTAGIISEEVSETLSFISGKLEVVALAGIGMKVNLNSLLSQGGKISVYAASVGVFQVLLAAVLIFILF